MTYDADYVPTLPNVGAWVDVCRLNEIRPDRARAVLVDGVELVVCRETAEPGESEVVHTLDGRCPYRDAPLADAHIIDGLVICPLHGCDFEPRSGISLSNPNQRLRRFPTKVTDGTVSVFITERGPGVPDTYLGRWSRRRGAEADVQHVHALAEGRQPRSTPETVPASHPSFDNIRFVPAGLAALPVPDSTPVDTSTVLGPQADRPLRLRTPVIIGHVSYGHVSIETKVALARGARAAGTVVGSGDGGAHGRERDAASTYLVQVLPGQRLTEQQLAEADALELRISEGRAPATPAWLPASAVTTEVGLHRDLLPHVDYRGPSYSDLQHIAADITYLREASKGVPIGVKVAAGAIEADLELALSMGVDFITLDAPQLAGHAGVPALAALVRARRVLARHKADVSLIIAGGFYRSDHIVKALALGANAVAVTSAALRAIGCQRYQACSSGNCPVGIATQDTSLRLRLNPDISARRLSTYIDSLTADIGTLCAMMGKSSVALLNPTDLVCVDDATAFATGLGTAFAPVTN